MKKQSILKFVLVIVGLLSSTHFNSWGQFQTPSNTPYKFKQDILDKIAKDSVSWKYQLGATDLSFIGAYPEVMQFWDKNGSRKPVLTAEDSLYFKQSKQVSAREYILTEAKKAPLLIINEAHHVGAHRTFTRSLLKDLYQQGYRYLGMEALFKADFQNRQFAVTETGHYTQEPEMALLVAEALKIGYTLFNYEATGNENGKEREIAQAKNIQQFMKANQTSQHGNQHGKVLIHCGYAHAYEIEHSNWGKAMAGRLKENLGIDPLTVDQTKFLERSNPEHTHAFMYGNKLGEPMVLLANGGKGPVYSGSTAVPAGKISQAGQAASSTTMPAEQISPNGHTTNGQSPNIPPSTPPTDIIVIHPITQFIDGKPDWFIRGKYKYILPTNKIPANESLILAYREGEFDANGTPADIREFQPLARTEKENPSTSSTAKITKPSLYLLPGKYEIIIKNRQYEITDRFKVVVK